MSRVCRNCGHEARNHFSARSPIIKGCLEKDCKCDWAWNGKNDTIPIDRGSVGNDGDNRDLYATIDTMHVKVMGKKHS